MYYANGGEKTWFIRTIKMGDNEYQQRQKLKNYIHNVAVIKDTGMPDFTDEGRLDVFKGKTTTDVQDFLPIGCYVQAWKRDGTLISTMRVANTTVSGTNVYVWMDIHDQVTGSPNDFPIYIQTNVNGFNFHCNKLSQTKNYGGIGWDAAGITNPDGDTPNASFNLGYTSVGDNEYGKYHFLGLGERDWFVRKYGTQFLQLGIG